MLLIEMRSHPLQCKKRAFVPECDINHECRRVLVTQRSSRRNNRPWIARGARKNRRRRRDLGDSGGARLTNRRLASREILDGLRSLVPAISRRVSNTKKAPRSRRPLS